MFTARFHGRAIKSRSFIQGRGRRGNRPVTKGSLLPSIPASSAAKSRSRPHPVHHLNFQQEASRRLGMTPRRTMSIAQQLYEGVDITGRGTSAL